MLANCRLNEKLLPVQLLITQYNRARCADKGC